MAAILHAVPLSGVCRKGRSSPVPQVRERPEEMRCVGSKRTRELGRDMLLAASIVKSSVAKAHGRNRTVHHLDHTPMESLGCRQLDGATGKCSGEDDWQSSRQSA